MLLNPRLPSTWGGFAATGPELEDLPPQPRRNRRDGSARYAHNRFQAPLCVRDPGPDRRPILSVALTSHSTAEWVARQIAEALPWQETPQYLLRDGEAGDWHTLRQRLARAGRSRRRSNC